MKPILYRSLLSLLLSLSLLEPAAAQSTLRATDGGQESVAAFSDGHTLVVFAHQDDDVLWMLPFWPVASKFLLAAYPAPPIQRVITHNNWGEYGHVQHRLVNIAVRELAVETGLDVWAPGTRVLLNAGDLSQHVHVHVASKLGLPTIEGYFDPKIFRSVREVYQAHRPIASTPELTTTFLHWATTLWTGSDRPEDDRIGWRPFIKLVDRGVDLTAENPAVRGLERDVMVVNDCPTNPALPSP